MISVNTLAEVPDADAYIVEVGMANTDHPAAALNDEEIRNKMGLGEWFVRTGDSREEVELMKQIDEQIDHGGLPAYLILGSHPQSATDAVVIYLSDVESSEGAWQRLEDAISAIRDLSATEEDLDLSKLADHLNRKNVWTAMNAGSLAIQYITFAGLA